MKELNNKGFTLIELLAVIAILVTITLIAIPSVTSSLERSKEKQLNAKYRLIESAAEIYVSDHRNAYTEGKTYCIDISDLTNEGLLNEDEIKDNSGKQITGYVKYDKCTTPNTYTYASSCSSSSCS